MSNQSITTKICSKCKEEKSVSEFLKHKITKDGLRSQCNFCLKQYNQKRYSENPEKIKAQKRKWNFKNPEYGKNYKFKNKDKIKQHRKQYNQNNKEKIKESCKCYYLKNKDKIKLINKQYTLNNKEHLKQCRNKQRKLRRKTDINFKILETCRRRNWNALKGICKSALTTNLLMCSIAELKLYLEKLWLPGMSWNNYGFGDNKWHIDHIVPCSFFNMLDPVEQYMCFRWQNLQPLWQTDNFKKSDKIIKN